MMAIKPILFSGPMVCANLDGRKTQTRRVVKSEIPANAEVYWAKLRDCWMWQTPIKEYPGKCFRNEDGEFSVQHAVGDLLWVRETFTTTQHGKAVYRADATDQDGQRWSSIAPGDPNKEVLWKPSIFMPRKHSRITLEVTNVRVERLQDISESDAKAEGVPHYLEGNIGEEVYCSRCRGNGVHGALGQNLGVIEVDCENCDTPVKIFRNLWDNLNEKRGFSWDSNPWVSVTEFEVYRKNVDHMERRAAG